MLNIIRALFESVLVLVGCFVVLFMGGLDRANSPLALKVVGVVAAIYFVARSLSEPAASDRSSPRRSAIPIPATYSGGIGASLTFAAMTSMVDDDESSAFQSDHRSPASDEDEAVHTFNALQINPANGLPMFGAVDVMGNAYGTDLSTSFDSFSSSDDSFGNSIF